VITFESLKKLIHSYGYAKPDARLHSLLLILFYEKNRPKKIKEIIKIGKDIGLKDIGKWNVSNYLRRAKGKAILTPGGWELSPAVHSDFISEIGNPEKVSIVSGVRKHLAKIKNRQILEFIEEAISCFENDQNRAAVVLSWVGAVAILYEHILKNSLTDFNVDASRRYSGRGEKWKYAKTVDDLGEMKEFEFLEVLRTISVIGKSEKDVLNSCLKLRNGCGHPNSLKIGPKKVEAHLEDLILNVYSKFI
jgi:hypothetical protein